MQGKKSHQEKLFTDFRISERVPQENFYRRLKGIVDIDFLYKQTRRYYGDCGQKSIDPVVFFKICLVGYLENIISDRQLIQHCSMRLDILLFLGYDIDEVLPWHSTISRTRDLFPAAVFEEVFEKVLGMCVAGGMVSGHTQAIDSAPVKANASMDSLELKVPPETLVEHLRKVRYMSTADRKAKKNKAGAEQRTITASDRELNEIKSRNNRWRKDQDGRPGSRNKGAKYTSNHTHYSPTDPDARISVKPGKARNLNYMSQLGVDTAHHVITYIGSHYADKKDSQCLQAVTIKLQQRLRNHGLLWQNLLADTGYSSGENYAFLEARGLNSYIPAHGMYKGGPEGFTYHKEGDRWQCPEGKWLTFRGTKINNKGRKENHYAASRADCRGCPIATSCKGKSQEKRIRITYYTKEYERAIARVESKRGRFMKSKRQSTVEPVFGTLTQYMGMRKVNTRGISNANKVMLMAAVAYNIKKYLKFTKNKVETISNQAQVGLLSLLCRIWSEIVGFKLSKLSISI